MISLSNRNCIVAKATLTLGLFDSCQPMAAGLYFSRTEVQALKDC